MVKNSNISIGSLGGTSDELSGNTLKVPLQNSRTLHIKSSGGDDSRFASINISSGNLDDGRNLKNMPTITAEPLSQSRTLKNIQESAGSTLTHSRTLGAISSTAIAAAGHNNVFRKSQFSNQAEINKRIQIKAGGSSSPNDKKVKKEESSSTSSFCSDASYTDSKSSHSPTSSSSSSSSNNNSAKSNGEAIPIPQEVINWTLGRSNPSMLSLK